MSFKQVLVELTICLLGPNSEYIIGYISIMVAMFAMWRFSAETPIWLVVVITSAAGLGLGAIGTINTLVAQSAVPKRLLGVAVGAIFFFQIIALSVAPVLLGLAQNSSPDLEIGLQRVFLVGAVAAVGSMLLIITIPEISLDEAKQVQ